MARETAHVCAAGCRRDGASVTHRAATLAARLPPKGIVGYDVIVFVGLSRFVEHRQREEIRATLEAQHGIVLSTGEISTLGRRFLGYLELLHEARAATRAPQPADRARLDAARHAEGSAYPDGPAALARLHDDERSST